MAKIDEYEPPFLKSCTPRSYRYFYKWGRPDFFYVPNPRGRVYEYVRDKMGLSDDFFTEPNYADEVVKVDNVSTNLDNKDIDKLRAIVGDENVKLDLDERIKASITKCNDELIAMHKGMLPPIVDAVICPGYDSEIVDILAYAKKRKIKVVVKSALMPKGSDKKCIALDLTLRYNKVVEFNEVNSYVKVEAGMYLPILEDIMNNAPDNFKDYGVENKFTIGHFPTEYAECTILDANSSFEVGQEAGFYGRFGDMVLKREYLTADGKSDEYSEGAILSTVTIRLTKYYPHNRYGFSYMFRNIEDAIGALHEIYTRNTAIPVHIRLSDARETAMLMRYYLLDDTPVDGLLKMYKCMDEERCMLVGFSGGAYSYSRLAFNSVRKIAKKYKGKSMTSFVADAYEDSRFNDNYVREALADFDIVTLREQYELGWSELPSRYRELMTNVESGFGRARIIAANKDGVVLEIVRFKA